MPPENMCAVFDYAVRVTELPPGLDPVAVTPVTLCEVPWMYEPPACLADKTLLLAAFLLKVPVMVLTGVCFYDESFVCFRIVVSYY